MSDLRAVIEKYLLKPSLPTVVMDVADLRLLLDAAKSTLPKEPVYGVFVGTPLRLKTKTGRLDTAMGHAAAELANGHNVLVEIG